MKKTYFILIFFSLIFSVASAQKVEIKGTMQYNQPVRMVYLSYQVGDETVLDSSKSGNTQFHFTKTIDEPTIASIMVRFQPLAGQERPRMERKEFFMQPGLIKIDIKDSLKFAKISGTQANVDYQKLVSMLEPFQKRELALRKQSIEFRKEKNEEGMAKIEKEMDRISEEKNEKVYRRFLIENIKSPVALYVLQQYAGYSIDAKKIDPFFKKLPDDTRKTPSAIAFKKEIEIAKKTGVGVMAMDFTQNDTLGNPVSLSSFKGKYVLLDFWASWCGPCRAENPNVVKAFNKYNNKGFTVLGVSLDQPGKHQAWLDAINKDGLTWTQVSDLKFWNNEVAKMYGIRAIPQNFLIDPTGKIIAKNITGEELDKKLAEVLK